MTKWVMNILPWVLVLVLLHIIFFQNRRSESGEEPYRDTVWDTMRVAVPEEVRNVELGMRSYRVKRAESDKEAKRTETTKTTAVAEDAKTAEITAKASEPDSVEVLLPIEQKVYEDSTYKAWVSGYDARLDSVIFLMPREVITVREYRKPSRWSVGVHVGYGMTLTGKPQLSPYIGVGVSYNINVNDINRLWESIF